MQYYFVIVTGDLKLDRFEPDSHEGKVLLDLEMEQGFQCLVINPRRIQIRGSVLTKTLIDVILTNEPQLFTECVVYQSELGDHRLVFGFLKEKIKPQNGKIVKFRSFKEFDDVEQY